MNKFALQFTSRALSDIGNLYDYIETVCKSPRTAKKYVLELRDVIKKLEYSADSFLVQNNIFLSKYGENVRRVNYKKMAIIFTIRDNNVLIHRILPSALITTS